MRPVLQAAYWLDFHPFKCFGESSTMRPVLQAAILIIGLGLIVLGVVVKWAVMPGLINDLILTNLDLSPGTEAYKNWAGKPRVDVLMRFNILNVTNPEEVKNGAKPILDEVGPFTYRENRHKKNILTVNEYISYGSYQDFVFVPEKSVGSDSMELTILNPLLASIPALINIIGGLPSELDPILKQDLMLGCGNIFTCLNYAIQGMWDCGEHAQPSLIKCKDFTNITDSLEDDIFNKVTARDIIFDGYSPGVLKFAFVLLDWANYVLFSGKFDSILDSLNITLPDDFQLPELPPEIVSGSFALFSNATTSWAMINSGKYDIEKYNSYVEYNGMTKLPDTWWADFGPTPNAHKSGIKGVCKDLVGTDVGAFPPFLNKEDDLWIYSSELCRSIWLSFDHEVDMKGIHFYQYSLMQDVLNMSDPNNFCYCPGVQYCAVEVEGEDRWDLSGCLHCQDGLLNIMGCRVAPVVISTPHFLDSSPSLSENLIGMDPDPEKHKTYLNIEPRIGVPLQSAKRMQVNVPLYPWQELEVMKNLKETIFPILWLDEGYELEDDIADSVKGYLVTPVLAVDVSMYVVIGLGGILVVGALLAKCISNKNSAYVQKQ